MSVSPADDEEEEVSHTRHKMSSTWKYAKKKEPVVVPEKPKKVEKRQKVKLCQGDRIATANNAIYSVTKALGSGGFGDVFLVVDDAGNKYAMKTETELLDALGKVNPRASRLKMEHEIMEVVKLKGACAHLLSLVDFGKAESGQTPFKFIVMHLLSKDVELIRRLQPGEQFLNYTAFNIYIQALRAVKELNELGYLHRDLKLQNFAFGTGAKATTIFLFDFGIARKFRENGKIIAPRTRVDFIGTRMFCSRAGLLGFERSARDEAESMIFIAIYMFCRHEMTWQTFHQLAAHPDEVVIEIAREMDKTFNRLNFDSDPRLRFAWLYTLMGYVDGLQYSSYVDWNYMINVVRVHCLMRNIDPNAIYYEMEEGLKVGEKLNTPDEEDLFSAKEPSRSGFDKKKPHKGLKKLADLLWKKSKVDATATTATTAATPTAATPKVGSKKRNKKSEKVTTTKTTTTVVTTAGGVVGGQKEHATGRSENAKSSPPAFGNSDKTQNSELGDL